MSLCLPVANRKALLYGVSARMEKKVTMAGSNMYVYQVMSFSVQVLMDDIPTESASHPHQGVLRSIS